MAGMATSSAASTDPAIVKSTQHSSPYRAVTESIDGHPYVHTARLIPR